MFQLKCSLYFPSSSLVPSLVHATTKGAILAALHQAKPIAGGGVQAYRSAPSVPSPLHPTPNLAYPPLAYPPLALQEG